MRRLTLSEFFKTVETSENIHYAPMDFHNCALGFYALNFRSLDRLVDPVYCVQCFSTLKGGSSLTAIPFNSGKRRINRDFQEEYHIGRYGKGSIQRCYPCDFNTLRSLVSH